MSAYDDARRAYDAKTKPRGSLGRIEDLGSRLAGIRGFVPVRLEKAIVVAAGDHGVAAEGVSAYPQEVTAQMLANFAAGGAAVNVLARRADARLVVVDRGVGAGTSNMTKGPAMTAEEVQRELVAADDLVAELDVDVIALGEMGIANTTSASALTAALLGLDAALVCGRGTGLDDVGVARKVDAVRRSLAVNAGADPLTALGGFEIAFLAGVALACERRRIAVLLDGFITGAAALAAAHISPSAVDVMIAAHVSPEPGHALVLESLGLEPLLDLGLRLGEGSGAVAAVPVLRSASALLRDVALLSELGI